MLNLARSLRSTNRFRVFRPVYPASFVSLTRTFQKQTFNKRAFSTTKLSQSEFKEVETNGEKVVLSPIFVVNDSNFQERIIEESQHYPVILECTVGSEVTPEVLQFKKAVQEAILKEGGDIHLGKLDVLTHEHIATDLQIQEVPSLLAVCRGTLLKSMTGVQSAEAVSEFVWSFMHFFYYEELKELLAQGENYLKDGNLAEAVKSYSSILSKKKLKGEPLALCGLAQCSMKEGNFDTAQKLLDQVHTTYPKFSAHPYVKQVSSQLQVQKQAGSGVSEKDLLEKIQKDPKDLQSRYDLGVHYATTGAYEKCFEQMFAIISTDKEWNQQAAKKFVIQTITSLGDSDLAKKGRKGLQNIWYR